jgi:hypothetical protein
MRATAMTVMTTSSSVTSVPIQNGWFGVGQHLAKTLGPSRRAEQKVRDRDVNLANTSLLYGQVNTLGTFFLTLVDGEVTSESTVVFLTKFMNEFRDHIARVLTVLPRSS